ncbi:SDR family NAD(P)-dependent oxidoreductase [Thermotoga sp.]|uniref:SDR family NAD(P)-dependent oxidoreductase n=1 Tax=Thermotoga sp. TaxID=28240 RepID=UPI0025DECC5C|nr:SDR family NAD(P)-dependent oxidoreductase [Thermotoga sp.]
MELGIRGKKSLILAGSRGIGRAIVDVLKEEGAIVMIRARNENLLKRAGHNYVVCDLKREPDKLFEDVKEVDILVLNMEGPKPGYFDDEDFRDAIMRNYLPKMKEKRWSRIVAITSFSVISPLETLHTSNSTRMALTSFWKHFLSK